MNVFKSALKNCREPNEFLMHITRRTHNPSLIYPHRPTRKWGYRTAYGDSGVFASNPNYSPTSLLNSFRIKFIYFPSLYYKSVTILELKVKTQSFFT